MKTFVLLVAAALCAHQARAAAPAPDLDLGIDYYSRVTTPEGVTRESRYRETMLRRPGHVWVSRVLPQQAGGHAHDEDGTIKQTVALKPTQEHKHFNPVVLPRHVSLDNGALKVEYVDTHGKDVIAIPKAEYDNVNFDGSWANTYYLLDPKLVQAMPVSKRASTVSGARWHEREQNGVFQRVLWDQNKQIPLTIESGDTAGTFYRRVEVKAQAALRGALPWTQLKGYARKEYADFLD